MTASDDRMRRDDEIVALRRGDLATLIGWAEPGMRAERSKFGDIVNNGPAIVPAAIEDVAAINAWIVVKQRSGSVPWAALDRLCALYDPPPPEPEFSDDDVEAFRAAVWEDRAIVVTRSACRMYLRAAARVAAEPGDKP